MLRPSRPMIRPFMSSDGSSTTVTVVSAVWRRRDALQRVGDEVPRAALRLGSRLVLEHPHPPGELVAGLLLRLARAAALSPRACVRPATRSSSASWACLACFSSSWSWRTCVSRSASPWSRRSSSTSFRSISSSFASDALLDLQHLLAPVARAPRRSRLRSLHGLLAGLDLRLAPHGFAPRAARPRAAVSDAARLRRPRSCRRPRRPAARGRRLPAIPMAIPIPISTCRSSVGDQPPAAARRSAAGPSRQLPEKPFSGRHSLPEVAALSSARPP